MKRTQFPHLSLLGSRVGAALLAASLIAGPGQVPAAGAVEPAPEATTTATQVPNVEATTATPTASSAQASVITAPSPSPSPSHSLVTAAVDREGYRAAMAAATSSGGAEMGQSGRTATASAAGDTATTEALATESTWMPRFGVQGLDVSVYQPSIDWKQQWNMGARFVYIKASEGNYNLNPLFSSQYGGSRSVGMIRGAYHFANPAASSGADQARIFVKNGGGWSGDGYTMPPVLDFEGNPYAGQTINGYYQGNSCYDMSRAELAAWAREFGNTMKALTGRIPVMYTTASWWNSCVGSTGFAEWPLWVAKWPGVQSSSPGTLPSGWSSYSIWQYSEEGPFANGGDSNVWNGSLAQLQAFARGTVGSNGAIAAKWLATGGATGPLGAAKSTADICGLVGNGCYRAYANGNIYWTAATGAHPVTGTYWTAWDKAGWQAGIGYPTSDATCPDTTTTCHQTFQRGNAYNTPGIGTFVVKSSYMAAWKEAGWQDGIGYPKSNESCGLYGGGCYQAFTGGNIYWTTATGAHAVTGEYWRGWQRAGFQPKIGYPTGTVTCGLYDGGCYQPFTGGNIYWTADTGAHAVTGAYWKGWGEAGWQQKIGYPTGTVACGLYDGGCYQPFTGGNIYWTSATGAHAVTGEYWNGWQRAGLQPKIGYPTGTVTCGLYAGGCYQPFTGGNIYWTAGTGAHAVTGEYWNGWRRAGFQPKIGYPKGTVTCGLYAGGCYQPFTGGNIYWTSTTGAHAVTGAYWKGWGEAGWQRGIGYPTGSVACGLYGGGCYQPFTGGNIYWTSATGAHAVNQPFMEQWRLAGWQMGKLGYPQQAAVAYAGYKTVRFQGGTLTWTASGIKVAYS